MRTVTERHDVCSTDTQWLVQLSGYKWSLQQLGTNMAHAILLDVACGTGFGSHELAQRAGYVVGVDRSREAITDGCARYRAPNLAYLVMDATELAFSNRTFDAVISQDTIEHIPDDNRFVAEVARVLRPGGVFIVFTPYRERHTTTPDNPYHIREYSPDSLLKILQASFPKVQLWSRFPSSALRHVEHTLNEIRDYDRWGLRMVVPRRIRHWLGSLWLSLRRAKTLHQVEAEDVAYVPGASPKSTTMIAVCYAGTE